MFFGVKWSWGNQERHQRDQKEEGVPKEIFKMSGTWKGFRGMWFEAAIECPKEALEVWNGSGRPKKV